MPPYSVGGNIGVINGFSFDGGGGVKGVGGSSGSGWFLLVDVGANEAASDSRISRWSLLFFGGGGGDIDGGVIVSLCNIRLLSRYYLDKII